MDIPTGSEMLTALNRFLLWLEHEARPETKDTPRRFLSAWLDDWGFGYQEDPTDFFIDATFRSDALGLICLKNISFYSHCEHHLAPFFGTCDIGYIPQGGKVLGLSKFARVVSAFSRRLQMQERLTREIADCIRNNLTEDVIVVMKATHLCMASRGVQQPNVVTTTSEVRGLFASDTALRAEFYAL
jgi:GTP cyclohydrolase I